jgi:hypothetical protein
MPLPIKTTEEDLGVLADYLDKKVRFVPLAQLRTTVKAPHGDNRKIEAMRFIGLLERKDDDVKLTDDGHAFARTTGQRREEIVAARLKSIPLFEQTLEWMHFQKQHEPTKTQVAQFWSDKHGDKVDGAAGAALTDAVVFFMRLFGISGLGKFVAAGTGRDTHIEVDVARLGAFVTGATPAIMDSTDGKSSRGREQETPRHDSPPERRLVADGDADVSSVVNINIEVHVPGEAKPETVREIFRNMRKYVLGKPDIEEAKR